MNVRMAPLVLFSVVAAAFLLGCTSQPDIEVNNSPDNDGIVVSGRGEVIVTPDTGGLSLGVEVTRDTVAEAREAAAIAAQAVISSAKANGVEDRDVKTTGLSISPLYEFPRDRVRELVGYTVTNTVSITVRDLEVISAVIDDAVEAGGDDVRLNGISFDVEDRTEPAEKARLAAMEDARAKADLLAEAAGVEVGSALSITEVSFSQPPPIFFDADLKAGASVSTPIEPGSTSVVVDVQVRWSID